MLAWHAYPERAGAGPGAYLAVPALARFGILAAFTTRLGGSSADPWRSLNLSYVSGDDAGAVRSNRDRVLGSIGLDATRWTGGRQVHGANVERVTAAECGRGADSAETTIPGTDALWTDEPGVAIAVLTADCVPILLADPKRRRVAVVHAGWRGLVAGVVEKAASAFEDPAGVVAVVGPSIGPCCYEVGDDVRVPASERFGDDVMRDGNLDLWSGAWRAVRQAGVRDAAVAALCTRCESHRFFSHRAGDGGRQGVVAAVAP